MEDNSVYRQAFDLITQEVPLPAILRQLGESPEVCQGVIDGYCHIAGVWVERELKELGLEYMGTAFAGTQAAILQVKFKKAMK